MRGNEVVRACIPVIVLLCVFVGVCLQVPVLAYVIALLRRCRLSDGYIRWQYRCQTE